MKKKILSLFLTLSMLLSLLPPSALAAVGLVYVCGTQVSGASTRYWVTQPGGTAITATGASENNYHVKYDAEKEELTLRNATLTNAIAGGPAPGVNTIYAEASNLKVRLEGKNRVTSTKINGAPLETRFSGDIIISGDGELTAIGDYCGIYAYQDISISGGTISATGGSGGIVCHSGDIAISGGNVTGIATRAHGCGITRDFESSGLKLEVTGDSTVVGMGWNGATAIRTVSANTTHNVFAGTTEANAQEVPNPSADTWESPYIKLESGGKISGTVTMAAASLRNGAAPLVGATVQVLKNNKAHGVPSLTNELGAYITQPLPKGQYSVQVSKEGYEPTTSALLDLGTATLQQDVALTATPAQTYDVWVGGTQVTEANKDNVTQAGDGSKVAYDPATATLTLTDAKVAPDAAGIRFSKDLTIALTGRNSITSLGAAGITAGESDASLTIQAVNGAEASLNVVGYQEGILTKAGNITISSGTVNVSGNTENGISSTGVVSIHAEAAFSAASGNGKAISAQTIQQSHAIVAGNNIDGRDAAPVAPDGFANAKYVRMEKGYTISGTVTDGANTVEGATVQLKMDGENYGSVLTTDANGAYTTLKVAEGDYTLTADKSGYVPATSGTIHVSTADITGQTLAISANGQTMSVSNDTQWKAALANAAVSTINLTADIKVSGVAAVMRDLTVNGGSHTLSATVTGTDDWGVTQSGSTHSMFTIAPNNAVTINDVTIKGGSVTAVVNNGILNMNRVVITQSGAVEQDGGGLKNEGTGKAVLTDCAITRNVAKIGGGIKNHGAMVMNGCSVTENRNLGSIAGGGGIHNGENSAKATLYMNNCTVANNQSQEIGGGIANFGSQLYVLNTTITGNVSSTGTATANYGGGIGANGGEVTVVNSIITNNHASAGADTFVLSDIGRKSGTVYVYHSLVGQYITNQDGNTGLPDANIGNTINQTDAEGNIFAQYRSSPLLNQNGTAIGAKTFSRPVLIKQANNTYTTPLKKNTDLSYGKTGGSKVYFSYDFAAAPATAAIAYGEAPTYLLGTAGAVAVTTYQGGTLRAAGVRGSAEITDREYFTIDMEQVANCAVTGSHAFGNSHLKNTRISLTATPAANYAFIGWYAKGANGDKLLSTQMNYTHNLDSNVIIMAKVSDADPTLTAGSALRTSTENATVTFTADQPGAYYYAVVTSGATAPTIDTTGAGTPCGLGEQTISLTNLVADGAKAIYIVAKNSAGKMNTPIKIEISAYQSVTTVEIAADTVSNLTVGSTNELVYTVSPANASNKTVLWTSDHPEIATVQKDGTIIGIRAGTAIITATAEDSGKTDTCAVTVTDAAGSVAAVSSEAELAAAISNANIKTINVQTSFTVTAVSTVSRTMTIDGGGHTISAVVTGTDEWGKPQAGGNYGIFTVSNGATVTLDHMTVKGGSETAINNSGTLRMKDVILTQTGGSDAAGGGLHNAPGGVATLVDCAITRNVAHHGGGFINNGTMIMDRCSITENRNIGGVNSGGGGGQNAGSLYLNNCTLSNNQSTEIGGGINNYTGALYIINSTVTGNISNSGEDRVNFGGGIGNNGGELTVINSLLTNNYASAGADTFMPSDIGAFYGENVVVESSIVGATVSDSGTVSATIADIFANYRDGKLLDADGAEGDTAFNRPLLAKQANGTYAAPLAANKTGTIGGCATIFSYNDAGSHVSAIAHDAIYLIGVKNGIPVTTYQNGASRAAGVRGSMTTGVPLYTLKVAQGEYCAVTGGSAFGESYAENTQVTLTANAISGYRFVGWYHGTTLLSTAAAYTHTVTADITLTAKVEEMKTPPSGGHSNYFNIKATASEGGTITPNASRSVYEGANQTYTMKADTDYELADVLVDGVSVGKVTTYTFENVKKAHTIEAKFAKMAKKDLPFIDVDNADWFHDSVEYVYEKGLMTGTSADTFSPHWNTSRGMIVAILWRMEGKPAAKTPNPFADVKADQYYADAVAWAAEESIVTGYSGSKFAPDDTITREQLAAILWRYAKYNSQDVSAGENTNILSYQDFESISKYAIPALQWACGASIMSGKGEGILDPMGSATRAEAAAMLQRLLSK